MAVRGLSIFDAYKYSFVRELKYRKNFKLSSQCIDMLFEFEAGGVFEFAMATLDAMV